MIERGRVRLQAIDLPLGAITALGVLLRVVFKLFVGRRYFGEAFPASGDTSAWLAGFVSLIESGSYRTGTGEFAYFGRTPGYSFFLGPFYLIAGRDVRLGYELASWCQLLLDASVIYLMFAVGRRVWARREAGLVLAFLYASYPFTIVWSGLLHSESLSIFFLALAIYLDGQRIGWKWTTLVGALIGVAALMRPQVLVLIPLYALATGLRADSLSRGTRMALAFCVGAGAVYGVWPARNLLLHGKPVLVQDLRAFRNWSPDVIAFMQYMFAIKTDWEPQFSQVLGKGDVEFPPAAYLVPGDREKLDKAVALARTCSFGFTHWKGSLRAPATEWGCTDDVARIFIELRESQVRHNAFHYHVTVPLGNLQKALFKTNHADDASVLRRFMSQLFLYRSALILLGLLGAVILMRRCADPERFALMSVSYAAAWYMILCAGPLPQLRNIEIRYLLPADVLLLVPAAAFLSSLPDALVNAVRRSGRQQMSPS